MTPATSNQFRLRTLFAVITVCAVGFATMGLADPEMISVFFILLAIYMLIALPISGLVWFFGRYRASWHATEVLLLLFPFATWWTLLFTDLSAGKTLANLIEPVYFAPICGLLLPLSKSLIGSRLPRWASLIISTFIAIAGALAVFLLMPSLPE